MASTSFSTFNPNIPYADLVWKSGSYHIKTNDEQKCAGVSVKINKGYRFVSHSARILTLVSSSSAQVRRNWSRIQSTSWLYLDWRTEPKVFQDIIINPLEIVWTIWFVFNNGFQSLIPNLKYSQIVSVNPKAIWESATRRVSDFI